MHLQRDSRPMPAGLLPAPAPHPSLQAAFSRRAALSGAVASTGALAGSVGLMAADMGVPIAVPAASSTPAGPLTLAQAEAVDFAALWASLSPEAQTRIGALALEVETFDQIAQDGGFHTNAEDRDAAERRMNDVAHNDLRAAIWAALPVMLPTVYDEPYPLWQVLGSREAPAVVDVRGLGPCVLVAGGHEQWSARTGGRLVELGGAVDLDNAVPGAPPRWLFWTVADIEAERLRRHPEMAPDARAAA